MLDSTLGSDTAILKDGNDTISPLDLPIFLLYLLGFGALAGGLFFLYNFL